MLVPHSVWAIPSRENISRRNWLRLLQAGHSFECITEPYAQSLSIIGFWLAAPYGREMQFAAPSGELIAMCFKV